MDYLEKMAEIKSMANGKRFVIIEESVSGHCCFGYTIIDTKKEEHINSYHGFISVCECFDKESEELITEALNEFSKNKD